jgi:hypothetical protein
MAKGFFRGATPELIVFFVAFMVAAVGVGLGFLGFGINVRWLSIVGYCIAITAIVACFLSVAFGWAKMLVDAMKKIASFLKERHEK